MRQRSSICTTEGAVEQLHGRHQYLVIHGGYSCAGSVRSHLLRAAIEPEVEVCLVAGSLVLYPIKLGAPCSLTQHLTELSASCRWNMVLRDERAGKAVAGAVRKQGTDLHEPANGLLPDGGVVDERQVVLPQHVGQLRDPAAGLQQRAP